MKLVKQLLDYEKPIENNHCVFFTANSTIDARGNLVMGAGNALAAKKAHPFLPSELGFMIKDQSKFLICETFSCLGRIAAFQTKVHWKKPTPIPLLKESISQLEAMAIKEPGCTFHLPMPGVNNGKLSFDKVMPLLENLPDNVIVYHI